MPSPPDLHDAHRERRHQDDRLQLVGEEVEEVSRLRRELLEAREHPVGAVEAVTELEDGDGGQTARPRWKRDEQTRRDEEKREVEERQLVGRHLRRRHGGHDDRGEWAHQVDIEELIVLLACLAIHARGRAQHSASSRATVGQGRLESQVGEARHEALFDRSPMTTLLPRHSLS